MRELALRVDGRVDGIDREVHDVLEVEEVADTAPDDVAPLVLEAGARVEAEVPAVKTK